MEIKNISKWPRYSFMMLREISITDLLKSDQTKKKLSQSRNKLLHYCMLILGWIMGLVACTKIIASSSPIILENPYPGISIIASAGGFVIMHKLITPIIVLDGKSMQYPFWWSMCIGISAGIVGRLITIVLIDPWNYLNDLISLFNISGLIGLELVHRNY